MSKPKAVVSRGFDGTLKVTISASAWRSGESASATVSRNLNAAEARELASSLIAEADRLDAKAAAVAAKEASREKWRQREIAAGRMKVFTAAEFFRR